MEIRDDNVATLAQYLQQTLNPDPAVRRPAEQFLQSVEGNKNYGILLLHVVMKNDMEMSIRMAGAVVFKNYIKRNWMVDEDSTDKIDAGDRDTIKSQIVTAMLTAPALIQKQLSDSISLIGRSDFPNKWPGLITDMVQKFATGDFHVINGILQTAHSLFKRYRYEFKSQALWTEIKFVLDTFAQPLTDLFVATYNLTTAHANNADALRVIYGSLLSISKIFYSLNFQDIPEFFEDNMPTWMPLFHTLLTTQVPCLESTGSDEAGLLEELRSQIVSNIALYASKYDEEFEPYLPNFVTDIGTLLFSTSLEPKYDLLVSNALQFLRTVAERPKYASLFQDPGTLNNICEKVIIPNIQFRESDEELFEDNPEEYIRRDIEGSDVETRRRSACDLIKALAQQFEEKVTAIFSQYVQTMLAEYSTDNVNKWKHKNAAVYLVTSLVGKGQTQKHGVTQISNLVNLQDFTKQYIVPELDKDVNHLPVVKADSIKTIILFRSVLPPEMIVQECFPRLIRLLSANSIVVHSYAACCIEKIFALRAGDPPSSVVKQEMLAPYAGELLKSLFNIMNHKGSEENDFAIKAIMRSFQILQDSVIPYLSGLLPKLTEKLTNVAKNPSKPHFNHFLFECITLSIKIVCNKTPAAVTSFEEALFPIFQIILQQDVQELVPYVLQVLSMLLEFHSDVPEPYLALYPCLLAPALWERSGYVKPLTAILRAIIRKASPPLYQEHIKVNSLLGVFQKLISSRANDHEGFYLIQTMLEFTPTELIEPFIKEIYVLLFFRLTSSKTTKFVKGLIVFFCFTVNKFGAEKFVQLVDGIQPQMFGMIVEKLLVPDTQKISGGMERKITAVGLTKLLTESKGLVEGMYHNYWATVLKLVIALFELPEDETLHPEDHYIDVEDAPGYEVAYSQLAFADNKTVLDPLAGIADARIFLAQSLSKLSQTVPSKFSNIVLTSLSPPEQQVLKAYLDRAGVSLS